MSAIEELIHEVEMAVEGNDLSVSFLKMADEAREELAQLLAAKQTYALDGATCPAHGLKLVDGYCPSLTCVYSPPRK